MIQRKKIPDGILLKIKPFTKPNLNAGCQIIAKITSSRGTRRDVEIFLGGLSNMMTLTDTTILMTAVRALTEKAKSLMDEVQKKAKRRKRAK